MIKNSDLESIDYNNAEIYKPIIGINQSEKDSFEEIKEDLFSQAKHVPIDLDKTEANANAYQPILGINRRAHDRFETTQGETVIAQQKWEHFAQICLIDNTVIIGQVMDISTGGIGLKVAYHFDIIDSIPIKLTLSARKPSTHMFSYDSFSIPASIVRCEIIDRTYSIIGLMFAPESLELENNLKRLIAQIC